MSGALPHDPADPQEAPPDGCADPLLWRVAHALHIAHQPRSDNFCECKMFWPCTTWKMADEAMRVAMDRPPPRPRAGRSSNVGRW